MSLRFDLFGETRTPEEEKRIRQEQSIPEWSQIVQRYDLLPKIGDTEPERERKAAEAERILFESRVADAVDQTTLPNNVVAAELRKIADILDNNNER